MKILDTKSVTKYSSYLMLIAFLILTFLLIYFILGYNICHYNQKNTNPFLSNTFSIEHLGPYPVYRINYPFTETKFISGILNNSLDFIIGIIGFGGFAFYFFCLYKILKSLSRPKTFNKSVIIWIRTFMFYNFIFVFIYILFWIFISGSFNPVQLIFGTSPFILLGFVSAFVNSFFKKGFEMQTENDLTI
jgi:fatty acid desaturase